MMTFSSVNYGRRYLLMKNLIFCVDSDGCAMDTMTYKHELFFGPLASVCFELENKDEFQKNWEDINLYSETRGVNRFVGLVMSLESISYKGIENLKQWVDTTEELSNRSLEKEIDKQSSHDLELALQWSEEVNKQISESEGHDKPFDGVKETLKNLSDVGKVYIVSSANREAVEKEWQDHGLMTYVTDAYCQDRGKKEEAIADIAKENSGADIMMVGDSPGDLKAAKTNNVSFYPINVGKEKESWLRLKDEVLAKLMSGEFSKADEEKYIDEFWANLK